LKQREASGTGGHKCAYERETIRISGISNTIAKENETLLNGVVVGSGKPWCIHEAREGVQFLKENVEYQGGQRWLGKGSKERASLDLRATAGI
jgi:hypothetical protein